MDSADGRKYYKPGMARTDLSAAEVNELGQRLMKLTPGGSEYFTHSGDEYFVDMDAIVSFLERHHHYRLEMARTPAPSPNPSTSKEQGS